MALVSYGLFDRDTVPFAGPRSAPGVISTRPGSQWGGREGHTTWALVKDEIDCEERGEIEVKGLLYPVRVYEVAESASPEAGRA